MHVSGGADRLWHADRFGGDRCDERPSPSRGARLRRHCDYWSQGYATEVAELLVQFGLEHLRLRRIEATCDPANQASARVLQKAGLNYEGLMRSHLLIGGVGRDSLLYALVEDGQ
ncbi:GNAT family N-acetyltransferase [Mycolicibacterium sarraceniae]|uniref:GNAT family N-acetyltransferase n=1 Tax=Mycolicibacterium sarraceniae TaxID=1534348 RepID=UPI0018D8B840